MGGDGQTGGMADTTMVPQRKIISSGSGSGSSSGNGGIATCPKLVNSVPLSKMFAHQHEVQAVAHGDRCPSSPFRRCPLRRCRRPRARRASPQRRRQGENEGVAAPKALPGAR
eukprot:gene914-biopygen9245